MKVDYHGQVLLFEFSRTSQDVQLIILCAPEMLDELYLRNFLFTNDPLIEKPVNMAAYMP